MARHGRSFPQSTKRTSRGFPNYEGKTLEIDAAVRQTVGSNQSFEYVLGPLTAPGAIARWDPEVYGEAVYNEGLIHPETYGEQQGVEEDGVVAETRFSAVSFDYGILALRQGDLVIDAEIEDLTAEPVSSDVDIDYIIGTPGGAGKDLTFSYRVTKASPVLQRGQDLKFKWKVTGASQAGANLGLNWEVQPSTTTVGVNLGFNAAIDTSPPVVVVGSDLNFNFMVGINVLAGSDLGFDAIVQANATAGADADFTFEVELPRPRSELTFDAEVEQATPFAELPFDAAIAEAVNSDVEFDYGITGGVGSEIGFDYVINGSTAGTLSFDYEIIRTLSSDLAIDYEIEAEGDEDEEDTHDGPGRTQYVIVEPRRRIQQPVPVGSNLVIDHEIEEPVWADMGVTYAIHTLTSADMSQTYAVRNRVTQKHTIDHQIIDFYDTNRGLLLAEIDQDLADVA